jgi:tetratricopeptide (TPR) repeat protein
MEAEEIVAAAGTSQGQFDALWDWDDAVGSEARFRDAAAAAATPRERNVLLTQVARAVGLQTRYAEAEALLDSLGTGGDAELRSRIVLERGRVLNSSGRREEARPLFEAAERTAVAAGLEHLAVDAVHMQAIAADPARQAGLNERAIAMAEVASDPRARQWLASLYNNLGWTRFDEGELDEALRLFRLALVERERSQQPREIGIARWTVARALRAVGQVEDALAGQLVLAADNAAAGVQDPYVDEEIGECLLALGRRDDARPHLALAADGLAADPWTAEHEAPRIVRLRALAADDRATDGG